MNESQILSIHAATFLALLNLASEATKTNLD
jgi:hypothetical protein